MTDAYVLRNMIEAEQVDFAELLRELTPEQWALRSLCRGWTVHDVVLHIAWHSHTTDVARVLELARFRLSEARVHEPDRARPTHELIDWLASPPTLARPSNIRTQLAEPPSTNKTYDGRSQSCARSRPSGSTSCSTSHSPGQAVAPSHPPDDEAKDYGLSPVTSAGLPEADPK